MNILRRKSCIWLRIRGAFQTLLRWARSRLGTSAADLCDRHPAVAQALAREGTRRYSLTWRRHSSPGSPWASIARPAADQPRPDLARPRLSLPWQPGWPRQTLHIGDTKDPVLKPWAAKQMQDSNDEVLTGKRGLPFSAQSFCYPQRSRAVADAGAAVLFHPDAQRSVDDLGIRSHGASHLHDRQALIP